MNKFANAVLQVNSATIEHNNGSWKTRQMRGSIIALTTRRILVLFTSFYALFVLLLGLKMDHRLVDSRRNSENAAKIISPTNSSNAVEAEAELRSQLVQLTSKVIKQESKVTELQQQLQDSKRAKWQFAPVRNDESWIIPSSRFTPHISKLVGLFDPEVRPCKGAEKLIVSVAADQTITLQTQDSEKKTLSNTYRLAFQKRVVKSILDKTPRVFPTGNVTLYISNRDGITYPQVCAFGASAHKGHYTVFNWQEVWSWKMAPQQQVPLPLPWEQRQKIPVWRGTAYAGVHKPQKEALDVEMEHIWKENPTIDATTAGNVFLNKLFNTTTFHKRLFLCHFSNQHPDLVNARLPNPNGIPKDWWQHNATNGLHTFLPFDPIPEKQYYARYQVQVVMGGLRAAFRTATILRQGTAVMLQDFPFEEWFVQYMTPWVHYVPLAQDLSDLKGRLQWVKENPKRVREIALNGKAFYHQYLSHEAMDEFYYELLFRLLLKVRNQKDEIVQMVT